MIVTTLAAFALMGSSKPTAPLLAVWRKPDQGGRSCAACHSPDGIELSAYNFSPDDISRRASRHLATADQLLILEHLMGLRGKIKKPLNLEPMRDRPLQPGGTALAGKTAAERDAAFLLQLKDKAPTLVTKEIKSLADAEKARAELLRLDLRKVRVGFEFSRLSEDAFHGSEHATMAQWIPDNPVNLTSEAFAAQDRYLENPTPENLEKIDEEILKATRFRTPLDYLSLHKYRALLAFQHELRVRAGWATQPLKKPLGSKTSANPAWLIADTARLHAESTPRMLGMSADMARTKSVPLAEQMSKLRTPWFWMAWLEDPALSQSGAIPETRTGHYFVRSLIDDGYPLHALFAATVRMARLADSKSYWPEPFARHPEIQYSAMVIDGLLPAAKWRTKEFDRLLANSLRMSLHLVLRDVEVTGRAVRPESQVGQIRNLVANLPMLTDADRKLAEQTAKALEAAKREQAW